MSSTIEIAVPNGIRKLCRCPGGRQVCTCHARAISSVLWAGVSPQAE
jgi:hypothetical protein